jgi:hypothetical protein
MNYRVLVLFLLLLATLAIPASAELIVKNGNAAYNASGSLVSSGYYHDTGYVPEIYVWFAIILGIITMVVSTYTTAELNVFVLFTPVFWAYAAWYAAFMEREIVTAIAGANPGDVQVVYTEVVYSQPVLQYAMTFLFFVSVIFAIYVLFLKDADKVIDERVSNR